MHSLQNTPITTSSFHSCPLQLLEKIYIWVRWRDLRRDGALAKVLWREDYSPSCWRIVALSLKAKANLIPSFITNKATWDRCVNACIQQVMNINFVYILHQTFQLFQTHHPSSWQTLLHYVSAGIPSVISRVREVLLYLYFFVFTLTL